MQAESASGIRRREGEDRREDRKVRQTEKKREVKKRKVEERTRKGEAEKTVWRVHGELRHSDHVIWSAFQAFISDILKGQQMEVFPQERRIFFSLPSNPNHHPYSLPKNSVFLF